MKKIEVFWGTDEDFENAISNLNNQSFLVDVMNHISKATIKVAGYDEEEDPLKVKNLIVHTDDYGGVREWAMLGFYNNVLTNLKVDIDNVWMCNPPKAIYDDVKRSFDGEIIEHTSHYIGIEESALRKIADGYNKAVIGQPNVIKKILPSIYALNNPNRNRPVTLLFLGDSGIGKTETAKFIGDNIGNEMVRIQFSMQQTINASTFIFGGEHGENSLARCLIRRKSNLILFDEFDKVPTAFFNAFYQMFDEGLYVDRHYTVDVSKCVIICTSNYQSEEDAKNNLGAPIYSRFSKVVTFNPISVGDKLKILRKTYSALISSIPENDRKLIPKEKIIDIFEKAIKQGAYPNMRMLKNDIEEAMYFEILYQKNIF